MCFGIGLIHHIVMYVKMHQIIVNGSVINDNPLKKAITVAVDVFSSSFCFDIPEFITDKKNVSTKFISNACSAVIMVMGFLCKTLY